MRTVIIDDDPFFAEVLAQKLRSFGLSTVKIVSNLDELKRAKTKPEVFFIDYHLKRGNCNKLIRYIEKQHYSSSIIVMSANSNAPKLLESKNRYYFFPKSKFRYLKYQIYDIKENILRRQKAQNYIKAIYFSIIIAVIYFCLYWLINS